MLKWGDKVGRIALPETNIQRKAHSCKATWEARKAPNQEGPWGLINAGIGRASAESTAKEMLTKRKVRRECIKCLQRKREMVVCVGGGTEMVSMVFQGRIYNFRGIRQG